MKKLMIGATLLTSLLAAGTAFAQAPLPPRGEPNETGEARGRMMVRPVGVFGAVASSTLREREMMNLPSREYRENATSTRGRKVNRVEIDKKRPALATSTAALYRLRQEQGEKPVMRPIRTAPQLHATTTSANSASSTPPRRGFVGGMMGGIGGFFQRMFRF